MKPRDKHWDPPFLPCRTCDGTGWLTGEEPDRTYLPIGGGYISRPYSVACDSCRGRGGVECCMDDCPLWATSVDADGCGWCEQHRAEYDYETRTGRDWSEVEEIAVAVALGEHAALAVSVAGLRETQECPVARGTMAELVGTVAATAMALVGAWGWLTL